MRRADYVQGTSAGSIVGSAVAMGVDLNLLAEVQRSVASVTPGASGPPDLTPLLAFMQRMPPIGEPSIELRKEIGAFSLSSKTMSEDAFVAMIGGGLAPGAWPEKYACTTVDAETGEFRYANELVEFIRAETGDWFSIEVAAYPEWHPQARSPKDDLDAFARKVKAGANSAITQYFYNADAYFHFVDQVRKMGITQPIIPGIMPISNFTQLKRFSEACGAEIPRWVSKRMSAFGDDSDSIREFAADIVAAMCQRLLAAGVPELHFYTLNLAKPTQSVLSRLA